MSARGALKLTFAMQQSGTLSAILESNGMPGAKVDLEAWKTIEVRAMPNESCSCAVKIVLENEKTATSCTDRDTCC